MSVHRIIDGDGHVFEDNDAIGKHLPEPFRRWKYAHGMFSEGSWFPPLGHLHVPTGVNPPGAFGGGKYVGPVEWSKFLDDTGIEASTLFPSDALTYGMIADADYAIAICRAYNEWLFEDYLDADSRFKGLGIIPLQEPDAAVAELRRIVEELGMCGACLPSTGIKTHLGSKEYWPIYAEADRLGCCLAVHGGNHIGLGFDHMNVFAPAHAIGHPLGMMINLGGMVFNGVFDRYPNLRVAYLEGGVAWLLLCMERFDSAFQTNSPIDLSGELLRLDDGQKPSEYIAKLARERRVSVGCEGDELMLSRAIRLLGNAPFLFSSDYPHEVSTALCLEHLREITESNQLSEVDKEAILCRNAEAFYAVTRPSARSSAAE